MFYMTTSVDNGPIEFEEGSTLQGVRAWVENYKQDHPNVEVHLYKDNTEIHL